MTATDYWQRLNNIDTARVVGVLLRKLQRPTRDSGHDPSCRCTDDDEPPWFLEHKCLIR